ncbi:MULTISPECIES: helix-turn-helix domain-containing protein [Lysobacter]|uniref:helix-turn-helix domain-containing protein n=1 Tax=Lysobacter TaxID=68 RepID=UPI001F3127BB|nr:MULTISPECIES: helix-turn-helix domain-containing protein [Lysobacter]UJB19211.1 helix-turn-helix domain-containing protein [Lysobacter capsici]UJQ27064.1 helix-turn-helix domain-containing protein [Lysobacter gummosus]
MSTPERPKPFRFFTTAELATHWQVDPKTLARWRRESVGPRFRKLGKRVIYTYQDIEDFETAALREPGRPVVVSDTQ